MNRLQRLQQTSTEKEQQQLSFQIQQDKLQAEADLLETQKQLSSKKQELDDLKSAKTLSLSRIISVQDEILGYERGEQAIIDLIEELFTDVKVKKK